MCSGCERLAQQRIRAQIDHADRQVIARAPVGVDLAQFFGRKRRRLGALHWCRRLTVEVQLLLSIVNEWF